MTLAQLSSLIDAENAMHKPAKATAERGSGMDLLALAAMAG